MREKMFNHFIFINGGTSFNFWPRDTVPGKKGRSMLQLHAKLALDAINSGRKDVFILDSDGNELSNNFLIAAVRGKYYV
tara:strand:+ start:2004 stop:2240 length:237 start_codon:yes stop_codon:yes gene_type:complete